MSVEDLGELPLVSGEVFNDLQAALQDTDSARRYLLSYLAMWDGRFVRLSAAVSSGSAEAAIDAVLSVRTSAQMVGALRLATLAAGIERHLAVGDIQAGASLLDELEACGQLTMEELGGKFLPREPDRTDGPRQDGQAPQPRPGLNDWLRRADDVFSGLARLAGQQLGLG